MKTKNYEIEFDVHVKVKRYAKGNNKTEAQFLAYTQLVEEANSKGVISGKYESAKVEKASCVKPSSPQFDIFGFDNDS